MAWEKGSIRGRRLRARNYIHDKDILLLNWQVYCWGSVGTSGTKKSWLAHGKTQGIYLRRILDYLPKKRRAYIIPIPFPRRDETRFQAPSILPAKDAVNSVIYLFINGLVQISMIQFYKQKFRLFDMKAETKNFNIVLIK